MRAAARRIVARRGLALLTSLGVLATSGLAQQSGGGPTSPLAAPASGATATPGTPAAAPGSSVTATPGTPAAAPTVSTQPPGTPEAPTPAPPLAVPADGAAPDADTDGFGVRTLPVFNRVEQHRWDRHVRGFRREHNFALSLGVTRGTWHVRRFGTLENQDYHTSGVWTRFQYSFHLPIYRGFGYVLGSSAGYHYETVDKRIPFEPVAAWMYPGVLAGLTLNVNPVLRITSVLDVYLERHNGIRDRDHVDPDPKIFVTLQTFDLGVFLDIFYQLNWALRLEAHRRRIEYQRPVAAQGYPVDANLKKDDEQLGLGLVYHLL